jgi:hypothetical protein
VASNTVVSFGPHTHRRLSGRRRCRSIIGSALGSSRLPAMHQNGVTEATPSALLLRAIAASRHPMAHNRLKNMMNEGKERLDTACRNGRLLHIMAAPVLGVPCGFDVCGKETSTHRKASAAVNTAYNGEIASINNLACQPRRDTSNGLALRQRRVCATIWMCRRLLVALASHRTDTHTGREAQHRNHHRVVPCKPMTSNVTTTTIFVTTVPERHGHRHPDRRPTEWHLCSRHLTARSECLQ